MGENSDRIELDSKGNTIIIVNGDDGDDDNGSGATAAIIIVVFLVVMIFGCLICCRCMQDEVDDHYKRLDTQFKMTKKKSQ